MARADHPERVRPCAVQALVPRFSEAFIHRAVRQYLSEEGWKLIAGQWPGGSDDTLHVLYVVDPTVARDLSPDPRRHSLDKFVPDVVALKHDTLLIVEAKPSYSQSDFDKLQRLIGERHEDLHAALRIFGRERGFPALLEPQTLAVRPALAFSARSHHSIPSPPWVMLLVDSAGGVSPEGDLP
jgi:hypothetical protein